ncbi:hypothetical protein M885DRAFT_120289 [Pelagophyceae sp. CCMP2097]|nr:hypothetical protein M885DRAFT_120289 [Pelagophyceae sp. CCMP2097]
MRSLGCYLGLSDFSPPPFPRAEATRSPPSYWSTTRKVDHLPLLVPRPLTKLLPRKGGVGPFFAHPPRRHQAPDYPRAPLPRIPCSPRDQLVPRKAPGPGPAGPSYKFYVRVRREG